MCRYLIFYTMFLGIPGWVPGDALGVGVLSIWPFHLREAGSQGGAEAELPLITGPQRWDGAIGPQIPLAGGLL